MQNLFLNDLAKDESRMAGSTNENNKNTITTLEIADMMELPHYEILKKLEGTTNPDGSVRQVGIIPTLGKEKIPVTNYFIKSTYTTSQNKKMPCYKVTKMGCDFLANKFNGEKGILFTARYVKRFADMEQGKNFGFDFNMLSPDMQMILNMGVKMAQAEIEQKKQAEEIRNVKETVNDLKAQITTHDTNYYTIAGYASLRGLNVDINKANLLGRRAARLSRENDYAITKTRDPRFGSVNMYHTDILKQIFADV